MVLANRPLCRNFVPNTGSLRTNDWYCQYQTLVVAVPMTGIIS
ncbi:MAG: hypothetical protein SPI30_08325 [Prevotella sp.]|nr:hypothetical protein [Prevotella sp.]